MTFRNENRAMKHDLIVIGGGPAGTAAAITAALAGARVVLLERGSFPRHKVCGEFVSAESLDLLSSLLAPEPALLAEAIRVSKTRIFVDGRVLETAIDPAAASIARLELDASLWKAAQRAGVELYQDHAVSTISGDGPFVVTTRAKTFEASSVINASGRWSNLNVIGSPNASQGKKWLGVKAHFAAGNPSTSVDLYFLPGGYCGVQPVQLLAEKPGLVRLNVCAMVRADVATTLEEVFARHPSLHERSRSWQRLTPSLTTSPVSFRRPQPVQANILMVGDAAGFVDPFVGDGISLALRSGKLAAQSLVPFHRREIRLEEAAGSYLKAYETELLPVFASSSKIRCLFALPKVMRVPLMLLFQGAPALTRYVVRKTR
jgi:menaquinone-9 beta-reductase